MLFNKFATERFAISHLKLIFSIILPFIYLFLILIMGSCHKNTAPSTGTLNGVIELINDTGDTNLDPVDYSGITISIYPLCAVDTTIVRLNGQYPGNGVIASQKTEFDHRLINPVVSGVTQADGSFSMGGIIEGQYNIVIMKPGWGFRYMYNYNIVSGTNKLTGDSGYSSIALYPEQTISGYIVSDNIVVKNKHHLVVSDNTYFLEGSTLTVNPGGVVRINPGVRIELRGFISMQGEADSMITIISNDQVFSDKQSSPSAFEGIVFRSESCINNGVVTHVNMRNSISGYRFENSVTVSNSIIHGTDGVISISGNETSEMQLNLVNCNIIQDSDSPNYSIIMAFLSSAVVEKIVLIGKYGISCTASTNVEIKNNYIDTEHVGIYLFYYVFDIEIINNEICAGEQAIYTYYYVDTIITYNNITSRVGCIYYFHFNTGVLRLNNFNCSNYAIDYITYSESSPENLPAQHNWFNTIDDNQIQQLIHDKNDVSPDNPIYPLVAYVDYIPYKTSMIPNAGIRP